MKEHISREEILSLPVTTNRLSIEWDRKAFFAAYGIVSCSMERKAGSDDVKNLSYEQLSDAPSLSACGVYAKYGEGRGPYTRFFVLTKRGGENDVLSGLRHHDNVAARIDTLDGYDVNLCLRIIATLAVNSIGRGRIDGMMYNDGSLIVCDSCNFGNKSKRELVCLKIDVNRYLNLTAGTVTFRRPRDRKDLQNNSACVFQTGPLMKGEVWSGRSLKPLVVKDVKKIKDDDLESLFIRGKQFGKSRNSVPYWPWKTATYNHGKLFVLRQVVDHVNGRYDGLLHLSFTDNDVLDYRESRPKDDVLALMRDYFEGRAIHIDDSFGTGASGLLASQLRDGMRKVTEGIVFTDAPAPDTMTVRLCGPQEDEETGKAYLKSGGRTVDTVLQHIVYSGDIYEDEVPEAKARRILLELLVKDCNARCSMPPVLADNLQGWEFIRWKINRKRVFGASLRVTDGNAMQFREYGFGYGIGEDYGSFIRGVVGYGSPERLDGRHDYMAMRRGDNTYLIIDTDEIPVLDCDLIDEAFCEASRRDEAKITSFKNKKGGRNHLYLRGYMGFHLWETDGMDGGQAFSYIAGWNSENINTTNPKIDRVPRARRILVLCCGNSAAVGKDIGDISDMLMQGFGRWDELMTYPYPFKFLKEYLDGRCEAVFGMHWDDVTYSKPLPDVANS